MYNGDTNSAIEYGIMDPRLSWAIWIRHLNLEEVSQNMIFHIMEETRKRKERVHRGKRRGPRTDPRETEWAKKRSVQKIKTSQTKRAAGENGVMDFG